MAGSARALGKTASHLSADLADHPFAPPSLVGILDRLEKKNLIGRLRSNEDRRHVHIIPTQKGRALMEHMMPMVERIHDDFMQRVTEPEWAEFNRILDKLSDPAEKRNLA